MKIFERITINAPTAKLWEILVENYDAMGEWSSAINHSHSNLAVAEGEVGRVCHTAVGTVAETITHMDETAHTFSYRTDRQPLFIRHAQNHYRIVAQDNGTSVLEMNAEVVVIPLLAWIVYPLLRIYLNNLVARFAEESSYYAQSGKIHPRKVKAMAKRGRFIRAIPTSIP